MPEDKPKTGQKLATATAATPVGKALKVSEYVTDPKKRKKTIWAIIGCGGCCLVPFVIGLILGIAVITSLCTSYFKVKPWLYVVAPVGTVATDIAGTDFVQSVYNKIPEFIRKATPFSWFMQFAKNKTFFEKTCKGSSYGFGNYLFGCISGEAALLFPEDCDPEAMAQAIDTYIQNGWPNSPMNGKGAYMVEAARKAGINPFLMAAQAQKESQFGSDPNSAPQYFNPFGTTGRGPNNSRHGRFTTYTSWEQAMDDYSVNYIRRYIAVEGDRTLYDIISRYAPPSENDTNLYVQQISGWMSKMYDLAGCSPGVGGINCPDGSFFGNLIETAKSFIGKLTTYSQARRGDFSSGYCDCSSFVSKVLQDNGVNIGLLATGGMASTWDAGNNAQVKPVMLPHATLSQEQLSQIQPGDIIIYGNAYTTNNAHVVIVQGVQGDTIYYIDCTSRGAGGVQLRNRSRTASSVWGVYRVVGG